MEFKNVMLSRHATRAFAKDRIPEEKIDELLDLVRWTPSGLNIQPWRIRVVRDQPTKEALAKAAGGQRHVADCSHLLVLFTENDLDGQLRRLEAAMVRAEVPAADCSGSLGYAKGLFSSFAPEALAAFMKNQVYIAFGTVLYAATSLGIDSCPVTGFDPKLVAQALGTPAHIMPTALCPLGYGTQPPASRVRVPVSEILI